MTWAHEQIDRLIESFQHKGFDEFAKEIEKYPDIKRLLNTKLKDMNSIPDYQRYLNLILPTERECFAENTLFDLIKYSMIPIPLNSKTRYEVLFSYNNEYPIGWFCYKIVNNNVDAIKMFSFGMDDWVFMRDVRDKFDEVIRSYDKITWEAVKDNPFIKHYIKAIIRYGGVCEPDIEDDSGIVFIIDKEKPNKDFSFLKEMFDEDLLKKCGVE